MKIETEIGYNQILQQNINKRIFPLINIDINKINLINQYIYVSSIIKLCIKAKQKQQSQGDQIKTYKKYRQGNHCLKNKSRNSYKIIQTTMKKHSRTNSRQLTSSVSSNNNFSEKYCQLTKEKRFVTPSKKTVNVKIQTKEHSPTKQILNVINRAATPKVKAQPSKIKINMEIKNLNIFSTESMSNLHNNNNSKKKKLHKKTISCLQQPKQTKKKLVQHSQTVKTLKHKKTKSQQNIKLSPQQWSQLLTKYSKPKKTVIQSQNVVSKFAFCNRTGFASQKKEKINQDTYIVIENFMKQHQYLFGVCDGHGINGHYVAQFIRQILPQNIEYYFIKNKLLHKHNKALVESSIKDAFLKTDKDLNREMENANIDIKFSGTTTCLTYIHENKIYCSNLGDSRAVIFSRNGEEWGAQPLSEDHKGENPVEAQRIIINGGRIAPYYDEDGEQMGPYRVWMKTQNIPGLAMTRSFGDIMASKVGVISQPEVIEFEVKKENKFMVVASDGLWEFISNEQVMNLVIPAFIRNDVNEAVQVLKNRAVESWVQQDDNIDDITIIVVFFKYY